MQASVVSGISRRFQRLSQRWGQVTHVLLTRSPLEYPQAGLSVRLACVKHAASVRPEPGSNSPTKTCCALDSRESSDFGMCRSMSRPIFTRHPTNRLSIPRKRQSKTVPTKNHQHLGQQSPASPHADHPNTLLSSQTTRQPKSIHIRDSASARATRTTLLVSNRIIEPGVIDPGHIRLSLHGVSGDPRASISDRAMTLKVCRWSP